MVRTIKFNFLEDGDAGFKREIAEVMIKVLIHLKMTGGTPGDIGQSVGVSSYTDNSSGNFTTNFSSTLSLSTYSRSDTCNADVSDPTIAAGATCWAPNLTKSTSAYRVVASYTRNSNDGWFDTPEYVSMIRGE